MLSKKFTFKLVILLLPLSYILSISVIYPHIYFVESKSQQLYIPVKDFFENDVPYLMADEIMSHDSNMVMNHSYAEMYNNPLKYKQAILYYLRNNNFDDKQLDTAMTLTCKLPPKNQLEFFTQLLKVSKKQPFNERNFSDIDTHLFLCLGQGKHFLPTGSYFWIPYIRQGYEKLYTETPVLENTVKSYLSGRTSYRYIKYMLGDSDT